MHSFSPEDINRVVCFIQNYAEDHAIMLPGRIPGLKQYEKAQLLPSNTTKREVYQAYHRSLRESPHRVASQKHFIYLWRKYVPNIFPCKPMSDLCWICQQNSTAIARTPLERQSEVISKVLYYCHNGVMIYM